MKRLLIGIFAFSAAIAALVVWKLAFQKPDGSVVFTPSGSAGFPEELVLGIGGFFDYNTYGRPGGEFETELEFWYVEKDVFKDKDGVETTLSKLDDVAHNLQLKLSDVRLLLYHRSNGTGFEDLYSRLSDVVRMGFGEIRLRNAEQYPYPPTDDWIPFKDRVGSTPEHKGPSLHVLLTQEGRLYAEKLGPLEINELPDWYSDGRVTRNHKIVLHMANGSSTARMIEVIDAFKSAGGDQVRLELSGDDGRISTDRPSE